MLELFNLILTGSGNLNQQLDAAAAAAVMVIKAKTREVLSFMLIIQVK